MSCYAVWTMQFPPAHRTTLKTASLFLWRRSETCATHKRCAPGTPCRPCCGLTTNTTGEPCSLSMTLLNSTTLNLPPLPPSEIPIPFDCCCLWSVWVITGLHAVKPRHESWIAGWACTFWERSARLLASFSLRLCLNVGVSCVLRWRSAFLYATITIIAICTHAVAVITPLLKLHRVLVSIAVEILPCYLQFLRVALSLCLGGLGAAAHGHAVTHTDSETSPDQYCSGNPSEVLRGA